MDHPIPGCVRKTGPGHLLLYRQSHRKHPQIVQAAIADDHEVGVHSHTHRKLTSLKEAQIRQDLVDAAHTLYNVTQQTVVYFRPPYGATNSAVNNIAHGLGQTVVTWNVDPRDWATTDSNQIVNQVLRQVQPVPSSCYTKEKPRLSRPCLLLFSGCAKRVMSSSLCRSCLASGPMNLFRSLLRPADSVPAPRCLLTRPSQPGQRSHRLD